MRDNTPESMLREYTFSMFIDFVFAFLALGVSVSFGHLGMLLISLIFGKKAVTNKRIKEIKNGLPKSYLHKAYRNFCILYTLSIGIVVAGFLTIFPISEAANPQGLLILGCVRKHEKSESFSCTLAGNA
jgi:hypothetical protein